jgi:hypothetical protein
MVGVFDLELGWLYICGFRFYMELGWMSWAAGRSAANHTHKVMLHCCRQTAGGVTCKSLHEVKLGTISFNFSLS